MFTQLIGTMHTKAFKNGNSRAVGIPAGIAFDSTDIDLNIERIRNKIIIRSVAKSPGDTLQQVKALPTFMLEGRVDQKQKKRESL